MALVVKADNQKEEMMNSGPTILFPEPDGQKKEYYAITSGAYVGDLNNLSDKLISFSGSGVFTELPPTEQSKVEDAISIVKEMKSYIEPIHSDTSKLVQMSNKSFYWTIIGIIMTILALLVTGAQIVLFFVYPR